MLDYYLLKGPVITSLGTLLHSGPTPKARVNKGSLARFFLFEMLVIMVTTILLVSIHNDTD